MPIWNRNAEKMDRDELRQLQLERLQTTVNRVYRNVPFYRRKFEQLNIVPEDVMSLGDVGKLPLTTKDDLRDGYPYEMFAVPMREIVRIHSSSPMMKVLNSVVNGSMLILALREWLMMMSISRRTVRMD